MRHFAAIGLAIGFVVFGIERVGAAEPAVGSPAPDFSLAGSDGATHSLAQHRGTRGVVLAWFPKAFTPG